MATCGSVDRDGMATSGEVAMAMAVGEVVGVEPRRRHGVVDAVFGSRAGIRGRWVVEGDGGREHGLQGAFGGGEAHGG